MVAIFPVTLAALILCTSIATPALAEPRAMKVTATAYNSTVAQTDGDPDIGACNERIAPGKNVIAVSRDLFSMGLECGTEVALEGFDENFTVLDKMSKRFSKRIDIHMGKKIRKAKEWGKQELMIWWYEE